MPTANPLLSLASLLLALLLAHLSNATIPASHYPPSLAYVSHSGFGHQLQMLLRGLFLSNAANRTLLVPPLMTHRASLDISGTKGCVGPRQIWEYKVKTDLLHASNRQQSRLCMSESDSFFRIFDFAGHDVKEIACPGRSGSSTAPFESPCTRLHDTLTVATPPPSGKGQWGCDSPVRPCAALVARVANRSAHRGVMCVGPINEYFVRGMLLMCKADYELARRLQRHGLPLHRSLRSKLKQLMPPLEKCTCIYTRLLDQLSSKVASARIGRDQERAARQLIETLEGSAAARAVLRESTAQSTGLRRKGEGSVRGSGGRHAQSDEAERAADGTVSRDAERARAKHDPPRIEVVSNCFPFVTCQEALRRTFGPRVVVCVRSSPWPLAHLRRDLTVQTAAFAMRTGAPVSAPRSSGAWDDCKQRRADL